MTKNKHEEITRIIGLVIDLDYNAALSVIKSECNGDEDLYLQTLELFESVYEDKTHKTEDIDKNFNKRSKIVRGITKFKTKKGLSSKLFEKKRGRLFFILSVFSALFILGIVYRNFVRKEIITTEINEQVTLLKTNIEVFNKWVEIESNRARAIASQKELIEYTRKLDSLAKMYGSKNTLRSSELLVKSTNHLLQLSQNEAIPIMGILNKENPSFLLHSAEIDSTGKSVLIGKKLGLSYYEYYLKVLNGKTIFAPPIHDAERVYKLPDNIIPTVVCSFATPIKNEKGIIIGVLSYSYPADREFSEIFQLSHHSLSAETFAFDNKGRMLSRSRFTEELQKTALLDFDSTKTTIYNIQLRNPEVKVSNKNIEAKELYKKGYTDIVKEIFSHLDINDSVYSGVISTPFNDYRGVKVVGAWQWFPEYNFGLISKQDAKEFNTSLNLFDWTFFLFTSLLIVAAIIIYRANLKMMSFNRKVEDFKQLGQYKTIRKLGEGGFGNVFLAEHAFLKNPVAIKILKKEFIGTDILDRFMKEVKVTSSLAHPNTIKVYDYGTTKDKEFYYVMEYLNGISLEQLLNTSKEISLSRGVYILLQVCFSLKEAHAKGLIHRDIKPANIMVCNMGGSFDVIKVLDFGLVKQQDSSISQQTQINRIGGTPMFMAPERIRDPFNSDARIDIYALGALGLYMFSGQYILELISQKMLAGQKTLSGDFNQQLIERKDIPEELNNLLSSCIHFNPDERPSNIDTLIENLEKLSSKYPWTRKDAEAWWKKFDVYGS